MDNKDIEIKNLELKKRILAFDCKERMLQYDLAIEAIKNR